MPLGIRILGVAPLLPGATPIRAERRHGLVIPALVLMAITLCAGCERSAPPSAAPRVAASGSAVQVQVVAASPCAWLALPEVEKIIGSEQIPPPLRVLSAENPRPSEMGEACLYQFPDTGAAKNTIAVQFIPDESGAMQAAFGAMGNVEKEFRNGTGVTDLKPAGHWDFIEVLPGGLTALRQGRISAQVTATGSMAEKGLLLATAMLDHLTDLPFVTDPLDVAVPAHAPDPCRLITRAEAEAVLGTLIVAPYRSRKATALAYGSGGSCSYLTAHHRALVLTPKESHGAQLFGMLGGTDAKVARQLHSSNSVEVASGDWDQLSVGVDGALHALKGDKMLSVQFITSTADQAATAKLLALALPRL